MEALLIHSDNVEPPPVQLSLTAECPKVGLGLALAEDWPSRTSSSPEALFYHLEAAVKGISADLKPTGASHVFASCTTEFAAPKAVECNGMVQPLGFWVV